MIGNEVLTCGGTVVTAKIYRIERSNYEDRARICFTFHNSDVDLYFENTTFRVLKGENDLIQRIKDSISSANAADMFSCVKIALDIINGYEKKDNGQHEIGNVIRLEIPFSKNGILGSSQNKYVIFDTPGSNSNSNTEHSRVLAEALDGFSNGIPVWISTFDNLDTNDNADLCKRILEIDALDKRFTMIICNRADQADLEGECLSETQTNEILEYNSVEDMYANGVYFVSSIMGIGSKCNGELKDKYYRKIYRQQIDAYENPNDEYYTSLYKFNIMPKQLKAKVLEYSAKCNNLVYANSGLYCVEKEMETFASRYAAYNKCRMVYMFLNDVINETNIRINDSKNTLMSRREIRKKELETEKTKLINNISSNAENMTNDFEKLSNSYIKDFATNKISFSHTVEEIDVITSNIRNENAGNTDIKYRKEMLDESNSTMWENLANNGKSIFKGSVISSAKNMVNELVSDYKDMRENKERYESIDRDIDIATSNIVVDMVAQEYRKNTLLAKDIENNKIKEYWMANAATFRNKLIEIITGTDALTRTQREEIQAIIINYEPLEFDDDANNIFIKTKYLRGNFFGLKINDDEKLNTKKLTKEYNNKIQENINEMAKLINNSCISSFNSWRKRLESVIEQNITEYNPNLRGMSELIREETEKIAELEQNQRTIQDSLDTIRTLMSWKTIE